MRKLAIVAALVLLAGCSRTETEAVSLVTIESDIYSMEEISEAADTIYAYL